MTHHIEIQGAAINWLKRYLTAKLEVEREFLLVHAETSLSRIWQHIQNPEVVFGIISGFITADKDTGIVLNPALSIGTQLKNMRALIADVKAAGFGYSVVEGMYMGQKERSVIVYGKKETAGTLLHFLKTAAKGETTNLLKVEPKFYQQAFIYKSENFTTGLLYEQDAGGNWSVVSIGEFSAIKGIDELYTKFLKKGQRWKKAFDDDSEDGKSKKFRFACVWNEGSNQNRHFNESLIKIPQSNLIAALKKALKKA